MDPESKKLLQQLYARPRDPAALRAVRDSFTEQRRFKGLSKVMEWWSDKAPTMAAAAESLLEAAESLERGRGEQEKVVELLERALQKDPKQTAASLRLEQIFRETGDQKRLEELLAMTGSQPISLIDELESVQEDADDYRSIRPSSSRPSSSRTSASAPSPSPASAAPSAPARSRSSVPAPASPPAPARPSKPSPLPAPRAKDPARIAPRPPVVPSAPLPAFPPPPALPRVPYPPQVLADREEKVPRRAEQPPEAEPASADGALSALAGAPLAETAAALPPFALAFPPDGFEPMLADDDDDDEETVFREPFGLDQIVGGDPEMGLSVGRSGAQPGREGSTVVEVIRSQQGRALGWRTIRGPRARIIGYRDRTAPFSLRLGSRGAVLKLREPVEGWVHSAGEGPGAEPRALPTQAADLQLSPGDSALLRHQGLDYRISAFRPPPSPAAADGGAGFSRRSRLYAICLALALGIHGLALLSIALLQSLGVTFKVEDRPQEEIFAEIRTKPPEERAKKPPPPPRIRRRKPPVPKELPPPERPAQIPRYLRKHLSNITKLKPGARAQRVLSALTSPVMGDGQTLRDVVTNLDAVRGGQKAGAFALGGTLAHLDGVGQVNIASGGGGDLGTLGGQEAVKDVQRLKARGKGGKVRGKVSAMSVGSRVTGSLSRGEVLAVINRHMARIQQCYERGLTRNPTLAGLVSFTWQIKTDGGVSGLRQSSSTLGDIPVSNCIAKVIERMRFPSPKGGPVSITFPFIFRRAQ